MKRRTTAFLAGLTLLSHYRCVGFAPLSGSCWRGGRVSSGSATGVWSSKKTSTASERERRDEERRRQDRAQDVVIGKTSARADASDFSLDVHATEEEWMRQANSVEQQVFRYTEKGMTALKMLEVEKASESFDNVFQLRPSAYLWQAGIAKFYLNELEEAADIFAKSASVFESKFGEPASEERIWRNACELKLLNSLDKKERKRIEGNGGMSELLPSIPENEFTATLLASERRKVIRIARDLFDATIVNDFSASILSRAKLRSVGGAFEEKPTMDRKMWKLNAWFYLGLYYDAMGNEEESKKCMKMALRLCPSSGNGSDIIHTLPMLHMAKRDWFDDEDFHVDGQSESQDEAKGSGVSTSTPSTPGNTGKRDADPLVAQTVRGGVAQLKMDELRDALRNRGLKGTGSKEELQRRLFGSLMDDAGLAP